MAPDRLSPRASVASGVARTRKWRPHGPGSPSGRSLTAETIGKATQKPCPTLEVRFPALVSRRDYALVSWRQTGRRATSHLKTRRLRPRQTGPYPAMKRKAISAEVRSQSLNLAASKAAIFFLAFITVDPGRRARYGVSAPYRMTYRPDTRSDTATPPPVPGCRWPSPRGPWWETAPGCRRRAPVLAERLRLRSG